MKKFIFIFLPIFALFFIFVTFFPKSTTSEALEVTTKTTKITTILKEPSIINKTSSSRWYTSFQVNQGKEVFSANCASCHGFNAEKTINWKEKLKDGSYPPPPLNDKAHAWHHPYNALVKIIKDGGKAYGGKMPAFKDTLKDEEIDSAIAYFQSLWGDQAYKEWLQRGGLNNK